MRDRPRKLPITSKSSQGRLAQMPGMDRPGASTRCATIPAFKMRSRNRCLAFHRIGATFRPLPLRPIKPRAQLISFTTKVQMLRRTNSQQETTRMSDQIHTAEERFRQKFATYKELAARVG